MSDDATLPADDSAIRHADPAEAAALSALALRSKAHWGYDAAFLEDCRDDLEVTANEIATSPVYVVDGDDGVAGYYRLAPLQDGVVDLAAFFVAPAAIGQGIGRRLWEHAVATATALGFAEIEIESDPHAEGFYRAMGAQRIGETESPVSAGRMLPLLRFRLRPDAAPPKPQRAALI
jgi:GNAT superfamily N-acetyltransferase